MTLIDQLWDFYQIEDWHRYKEPKESIDRYHERLIENGNIITVSDGDILLGYLEFWKITFEQFGRIVCGEHFSAYHEDVQGGLIAYVANAFIRPEYRNTGVYKKLRHKFFEANSNCTHFVGEARRKKSAPIKVFKRSQIASLNKVEV